jgi:hypothetical protein
MDRKIVVCIVLMLLLICLFLQFALTEETTDNAATYYNRAFELCTYSYKSPISKRVENVVKNGWTAEDKELEELLKQNESAIVEFKNGVKLEKCDFAFGKVYDNPYLEPLPNVAKVWDLANLIILKGRLYERNKEYSQAIEQYLSVFSFAQHISQYNKQMVSVMISKAVEQIACISIQQYLQKEELNLLLYKRILKFLQEIEPKRSTIVEAMERQKEDLESLGLVLPKEAFMNKHRLTFGKMQFYTISEEEEKYIEKFQEEFRKIKGKVIDKYYGLLIKYAQSNLVSDKESFKKELEFLKAKYTQKILLVTKTPEDFFNGLLKDIAEQKGSLSKVVYTASELMVVINTSNLYNAVDIYYRDEAEVIILKTAVAIKAYIVEKDRLPDTLSELVPDYLARVPVDPWSQKPLKYIKTDKKIIVYSFGPDRTDNNGAGTGYEKTVAELEGKDIVFSASIN